MLKLTIYPPTSRMINDFFIEQLEEEAEWTDLQQSDVVLLIVDHHTAEVFQQNYCSFYGKKVAAYVVELNYQTIPLIKLADYVIYQNEQQRRLVELTMGYEIPSDILPIPRFEFSECNLDHSWSSHAVIYSDYLLNEDVVIEHLQKSGYPLIPSEMNILFVSLSPQKPKVNPASLEYADMSAMRPDELPREARFMVLDDAFKSEDLSRRASRGDKTGLFYSSNGCSVEILRYFMVRRANPLIGNQPTMNMFRQRLEQVLNQVSRIIKTPVIPDSLNQLNVIAGKPLMNRFVFTICCRNQRHKLLRCVASICEQNGRHDIGVAVIDDASEYDVLDEVESILHKHKVDYCLVKNLSRKYAARNFYNMIHLLVPNNDSFLIELDGDDYLFDKDALNILSSAIEQGALKTRGNLVVDTGSEIKRNVFLQEKENCNAGYPRNMTKCSGWYHLRMTQRVVLNRVEIEHFLEKGNNWLISTHDLSVHSRALELARSRITQIDAEIYAYDLSGDQHDSIILDEGEMPDSWEYGTYLLQDDYLFKMYIPLFEEPRFVPSARIGEGLIQEIF
ncbi:glycosyltransferase family A protein [Paenibacillus sp. J14]|uniref:glycosyltransferase family A protein n=1 Tax=Paenibacillus sp. (strain J14) TaxID=935845 RepID=UPI0004900759|nr:glycosyltransferase family A protein [Paenibacillus sp. J14]